MKVVKFAVIVVVVVVIGVAYYFSGVEQNFLFLNSLKNKIASFVANKVNDCEIIMHQQNFTYALCTMLPNGTIALHDSTLKCGVQVSPVSSCGVTSYSTLFHPSDYFGLQINLQKLNAFYPTYYACAETNLPIIATAYPSRYGNVTTAGTISGKQFSCSPLLNGTDYHHLGFSGFILNQPDKYNFMQIWIFDGSLGQIDFENNLDKGKLVFTLSGDVV